MIAAAGRLAVLLLLAQPAQALTLDLPGRSTRVLQETEPLGGHRLATGPWTEGTLPHRVAEGAVTREVFQTDTPGLSTLQVLDPLRAQLAAQGYRTLLDCEDEACGGFDFRRAIEVLPPPGMFVDLADFRYLSAERDGETLSLLVSRSAEKGFVQVIRVAPTEVPAPALSPAVTPVAAPPAAPEPPPGPDGFARLIETEGRAVLDGLDFPSGSAELAPGAEAALEALAAYLAADPDRRVAIVGHTDAQGSLEANIALSKRRAQAVADRLVAAHGVARARLRAEGMGWLSPIATNLTPEGREANRRVEAVVLP
jgi:OOP family OmpA-OmpF porin